MLNVTNEAGYKFMWPDGSPYVEVYRDDVMYADQPLEVIPAGNEDRSIKTLNKLAFNTRDYSH